MLQPFTRESFSHHTANTEPDARADIRVRGFWTQSQNAFFDTRVFYPRASSYRSRPLTSIYCQLEKTKKGKYGERVTEVKRRFTDALATKHGELYSKVVTWMRCHLAYSLARSAIVCILGSHSTRCKLPQVPPVDLVWAETAIAIEEMIISSFLDV